MKISEAAKALVGDYIAITAHDPEGELKSIAIVPVSRVVELRAALEAYEHTGDPADEPYRLAGFTSHVTLDKAGIFAGALPERVAALALDRDATRASRDAAQRLADSLRKDLSAAREERDTFRNERDAALAVISRDTHAIREIQAEAAAFREDAQKRIADLQVERAKDAARIAELEAAKRTPATSRIAELEAALRLAREHAAELEAEAFTLRAERNAAHFNADEARNRIAELEAEAATLRANLEATQRAAGEWQDDSRELGAVKVALNAAGAPATDVHGVTMSTATRVRRIITDLKREANQARDEARTADAKLDRIRDALE